MREEQQANWFAASKQFRGHMHKQTHRGYRIHGWERKGLRDICKFSSLYLFGVAPGRFVCERGASGACYGKKRALLSGKQSQSPVQQKWPKEWLSKAAISRSPMASALFWPGFWLDQLIRPMEQRPTKWAAMKMSGTMSCKVEKPKCGEKNRKNKKQAMAAAKFD